MNRRHFLLCISVLPWAVTSVSAENPNQLSLLFGGFDGKTHSLGLQVNLAKGWKTYWRVPGSGGIPPSIEIKGENIASTKISHPAPHRFSDESGESIGYKDHVVFLIDVVPKDAAAPINATLDVFLGVCQDVCIPSQLKQDVQLTPQIGQGANASKIAEWKMRLPQLSNDPFPVQSIMAGPDGKTVTAQLAGLVDEIFIETETGLPLYFKQPTITGATAIIEIAGSKSVADLQGRRLRVTSVTKTMALEQVLDVV